MPSALENLNVKQSIGYSADAKVKYKVCIAKPLVTNVTLNANCIKFYEDYSACRVGYSVYMQCDMS